MFACTCVGQSTPIIPDGFYTLKPFMQESAGYAYSYDTDALRSPYGNVADYANPLGKNGEYAYLYAKPSTSAALASRTFYFHKNEDGTYTIQSCSGEAHSYLDIAQYDRHLLKFSLQPKKGFNLHSQSEDLTQLPNTEYIMQQVQNAALLDSLANKVQRLSSLQVIQPLDPEQITPALTLRLPLSDARAVLALYRPGDNPGEVPIILSSHLQELIDEAQTLINSKTTTNEQAEEITQKLREAITTYTAVAPLQLNPMKDGYYFFTSAYRAFQLRQNKQKVLMTGTGAEGSILRWNTPNTSDGTMAFRVSKADKDFVMQDYRGRYVSHPSAESHLLTLTEEGDGATQTLTYDTEGLWTIADSSQPMAYFSADGSYVGEKGLYGKPTDGNIVADGTMYLYPGYCSSWQIERAYHQLTVTSTGWASISVSFPCEVPADMEIFTVKDVNGSLYLIPYTLDVIPARTAVVVHAAKGTYTFWSTTKEVPDVNGNALVTNCEYLSGMEAGSMATLKVKNGEVGFAKTTAKTLAAGATYIPYSAGQDDFRPLKEGTDGIDTPTISQREGDVFDLSGRIVSPSSTKKGIYIINNKKILK